MFVAAGRDKVKILAEFINLNTTVRITVVVAVVISVTICPINPQEVLEFKDLV